jgi:hypothetical protein
VISYFPQVPDYQILNPEWLTVGIYHLFLHPTCTTTKKGRIVLADLGRIFEQPVTNSITKKAFEYQGRHHRYLLNLMREFQLCAENPHKKNEWLIPTGFAVNPKISFDDFRQQPLLGFTAQLYAFKYDTWIPSTILRTIAATIQWAENEDYWQNGILLKHTESQTQALVQGDEKEEMIKIWIKGERIRDFWLVLDAVISSISNFFEGNKYQKIVFLDEENKQFISYQALFHALIDKEFDLYLSEFRKRINVLDYLGMFQEQKMIEEELKKYVQTMEKDKQGNSFTFNAPINGPIGGIGSGFEVTQNNTINLQDAPIDDLRELLVELEDAVGDNRAWQDNFKKALENLIAIENAQTLPEQKESATRLKLFFKKVKEVSDWVTVGLLPVELAEKVPQVLEAGKELLGKMNMHF